jgi:collagen type III alpha
VPGNPAARTMPPDQYSEHTTDVSGRGPGAGSEPYVPAPALPSMHAAPPLENGFPPAQSPDSTQPFGERPRMGGVFPGPASRATVTPPGPEQTASWPNRVEPDEDQGRFDSFKQESPEIVPTEVAKPETPHVRMLPVILGVILGAGLIVGLTLGVTWLIARGSHDGGTGFSVSAGDCVRQEGNEAVTANCTDAGSFEVTAIVDAKEQCPDPNQPYVVNPTDNGRTQVLCLKPRG